VPIVPALWLFSVSLHALSDGRQKFSAGEEFDFGSCRHSDRNGVAGDLARRRARSEKLVTASVLLLPASLLLIAASVSGFARYLARYLAKSARFTKFIPASLLIISSPLFFVAASKHLTTASLLVITAKSRHSGAQASVWLPALKGKKCYPEEGSRCSSSPEGSK